MDRERRGSADRGTDGFRSTGGYREFAGVIDGTNFDIDPGRSVGARAADVGRGGPLWSPASCSSCSPLVDPIPSSSAGDHKGPPFPSSSALAPTDNPGDTILSPSAGDHKGPPNPPSSAPAPTDAVGRTSFSRSP